MNFSKVAVTLFAVIASVDAYTVTSHVRNCHSCVNQRSPLFVRPDAKVSRIRQFATSDDTSVVKKDESNNINLLKRIENAGLRLKPMALEAKKKSVIASENDDTSKSVLYTLQSCALFSLFILYRGYRGFFVIIPEVFRLTYAKMKATVEDPFEDNVEFLSSDGLDTSSKRESLRTRITVSILSVIITASYVISGLFKVLLMFARTIWGTSSVKTSFEAAADEMMETENQVSKITKKKREINGEGLSDYAP